MKVVNTHQAKTHLSRLLDEVADGVEIVIARAGKPIARLAPLQGGPRPKRLGLLRGKLVVPDDFDAPLPAEVLATFEGRGS